MSNEKDTRISGIVLAIVLALLAAWCIAGIAAIFTAL